MIRRLLPLVAAWMTAAVSVPACAQPFEVPASFLSALQPRPIGPANMGGRITGIAVVESRPVIMYVATASGGLWKTVNNGITWAPIFDQQKTGILGDVAVAPSNPAVVYVGTGEANPRNSVSWGNGVYRSTDAGKTWQSLGLAETHHIGRIVVHPTNPDVAWVAALGHLWGPNKERGIYKTTDGGRSWEQVKFIDADTGFIDLAIDPGQPDTLYAAAYRVRRDAFSGPNPVAQFSPTAGLYKTTDGGKTWDRLTRGLPSRPLGRCGIAVSRKNPRTLYAVVQTDLTDIRTVPGQAAKTGDDATTGGVFRSTDRGETWTKLNDLCPRPFYFGQVRIDPADESRVYVLGIRLHVSTDSGQTFHDRGAPEVHADVHALWIDPADPEHLVAGTDGGVYFSHDRGANWEHVNNLPIGQFYHVAVDMRTPYRIYGGLQDNGTWGGPSRTYSREGITRTDWFKVFGADGFGCQVDPLDGDQLYVQGQYGMLRRISLRSGTETDIRPRPLNQTDPEFRFNWNAPLVISAHRGRGIYYGGNHVFRSTNRGDAWKAISPDLTGGKPGPNEYRGSTLTTLSESPLKAGVLFTGTDDGHVSVTVNGGQDWFDVGARIAELDKERWVTRVECSPWAESTAYAAIDRHRNDDQKPYLFKTEDFGNKWKPLASNLPAGEPVHMVLADKTRRDLLYVGTETGLFVSINEGASWQRVPGLPPVPVHDLVVHPREQELVIATHGRSVWILDVAPLQQLTTAILAVPLHVFDIKPALLFQYREEHGLTAGKNYLAPNPDFGACIWYHLRDRVLPGTLIVRDAQGTLLVQLPLHSDPGLHRLCWNLRRGVKDDSPLVSPGTYTAELRVGDQVVRKTFRVQTDD
jgi:photosystem II stability/assembly factor-like uncharacterized protein